MENDYYPDVNGTELHVYNSFGFGLIRTEKFRFRVGVSLWGI